MPARLLILGLALWAAVPASAEDRRSAPPEEAIVIQPQSREMVEEYRINGRLFMIKIQPRKGPPYYLIDSDGDGVLDSRQDDLDPNMPVPSWVILRW